MIYCCDIVLFCVGVRPAGSTTKGHGPSPFVTSRTVVQVWRHVVELSVEATTLMQLVKSCRVAKLDSIDQRVSFRLLSRCAGPTL
jgi:hypothetical protein